MVVELSIAFVMRCPDCGRLGIDKVNIFQLSGKEGYDIYCNCGSKKAVLKRKKSGQIIANYQCIICDHSHSIVINKDKYLSNNSINSLYCPKTNLNLGYYGSYNLIKAELDRQKRELDIIADEMGLDDFIDPELMLDCLDYLHDLSAGGNLYCECGCHDIYIELFYDRIELTCNNCDASLTIPAGGKKDLGKLKIMDEIVLDLKHSRGPWINI